MERDSVPFIVHEGIVSRQERTIKRLVIALIIAISLMFISNCIWIHYVSMFDFESYEYTQDGEGINVLGDRNEVSKWVRNWGLEEEGEKMEDLVALLEEGCQGDQGEDET